MSDQFDQTPETPSWTVIYTTYNHAEAHIVAGRLQSEGLRVWVDQESAGSTIGITFGPLGELRVLVDERDYDAAVSLLGEDAGDLLPDDVDEEFYEDDDVEYDDDQPDDE